MNKKLVASELIKIAKSLVAIDFPTQDALNKYIKEHPEADKSNHKVVKKEHNLTDKHLENLGNSLQSKQKGPFVDKMVRLYGVNKVKSMLSDAMKVTNHKGMEYAGHIQEAINILEKKQGK